MKIRYNKLTKGLVIEADTAREKSEMKALAVELSEDNRQWGGVSMGKKQLSIAFSLVANKKEGI